MARNYALSRLPASGDVQQEENGNSLTLPAAGFGDIYISIMKVTGNTLTISRAQAGLPRLCNSGKSFLITNRDRPTAVLLPIADYSNNKYNNELDLTFEMRRSAHSVSG